MANKGFEISIELDTRSTKANGTHPVKIRVYSKEEKKFIRLKTDYSFTKEDYKRIYTLKPRKEFKGLKVKLDDLLKENIDRADRIKPFDLNVFATRAGKSKSSSELLDHFETIKDRLLDSGQVGTYQAYVSCQRCIERYVASQAKKVKLTFNRITVSWLNDFNRWMISEGLSTTTRYIYFTSLRAVINTPVDGKPIFDRESYPFGEHKFMIPASDPQKKLPLNNDQLNKLLSITSLTEAQEKARAFWFFSFFSNGMNLRDVALLRWSDIKDNYFTFQRSKTMRTTRKKPIIIKVFIDTFHKDVFTRYGIRLKSSQYIFPIVNPELTNIQQDKQITNFVISTNKNFQKVANKAGLNTAISSMTARVSYASKALREKVEPIKLMYSLGHANFSTTERYLSGFDDETMMVVQSSIMEGLNLNTTKK
jgi:integrase